MNLDERERYLLKLVEDHRNAACHALMTEARTEAAALIARTYRSERTRLHERVGTERIGARARIHAARAERDTLERAGGERANAQLLAAAWPLLHRRLLERWQDPAGRGAWIRNLVDEGRRVLPTGVWTLRHAPHGSVGEWQSLGVELTPLLDHEPRFVADGGLTAGLAIECAGAVLDGSLEGLLKDRNRVEARLLALLDNGARP